MPLQFGALRDARIDAGASEAKAKAAAEEVAAHSRRVPISTRLAALIRMMGFNIALTLLLLWCAFTH